MTDIKVDGSLFSKYKMRQSITNTAFYKLIAFKYLPDTVNKILYLDLDLIVKDNIFDLYNQKFDNKTLFYAGSEGITFDNYEFNKVYNEIS